MSAIYGVIGDSDPGELTAMGRRLVHLGDAAHEWSPAPGCRLGQRSASTEPMSGGPPYAAFDGWVDDPQALAQFVGEGDRSQDAVQLVLALLHKLGPAGARHIEGQFAIAFWDGAAGHLVLLRDRYGSRPLYCTRSRGRFLFASEYKALLALPDVAAKPDRGAIRHLQCTRYPMADRCLLAGVRPVARAAWTIVDPRSERVQRYWSPGVAIAARSDRDHVQALRQAFLDATRRQVAGFDRIGVQLSGGLDSALVVAAVRNVAPGLAIHTFTAGYGEDDPEIQAAERIAREFRTEHHPMVLEPEQIPDLLPRVLWHMEDPYGREDMVYLYQLAREAARHVDMLLAGYAADMLLGGMPRHRLAALALRLPWARTPLADFYHYTQTGIAPRSWAGRALLALYYRGRHVAPPRVRGTDHEPPRDSLIPEGAHPFSAFLARGVQEDLGWEALQSCHAAWGLSFNAPFMNPRFMDCAFALPDSLKIRGRTQKYALRRAGEGLLPAEALGRRKTLQRLRHDERFSAMLEELADELLDRASLVDRGLFLPSEVHALLCRPARRPFPTEQAYRVWTLIETEIWCRLFLDRRGRPICAQTDDASSALSRSTPMQEGDEG